MGEHSGGVESEVMVGRGRVRARVIWHVNGMVVGTKSRAHWLAETQPVEPAFGLSAISDMLIPSHRIGICDGGVSTLTAGAPIALATSRNALVWTDVPSESDRLFAQIQPRIAFRDVFARMSQSCAYSQFLNLLGFVRSRPRCTLS